MNENTDETEIRKTDEKLTGEIKTNGETTEKGGTVCVFYSSNATKRLQKNTLFPIFVPALQLYSIITPFDAFEIQHFP